MEGEENAEEMVEWREKRMLRRRRMKEKENIEERVEWREKRMLRRRLNEGRREC